MDESERAPSDSPSSPLQDAHLHTWHLHQGKCAPNARSPPSAAVREGGASVRKAGRVQCLLG